METKFKLTDLKAGTDIKYQQLDGESECVILHIRAIVDSNYVVFCIGSLDYMPNYEVKHINWFEHMAANLTKVEHNAT